MKKLFESALSGFNESASKVSVFQFDSPEEQEEFFMLEHSERCELFNVFDESGYEVMPGAIYHTYDFQVADGILVMFDRIAANV